MKVSRQKAAENRARVLKLASRRFRERGFHGVAVAELMGEAGLTHGGFYKQFRSKEDLAAQACAAAIQDNLAGYQGLAAQHPDQALRVTLQGMLSGEHRENWADGCTLAALGAEISRADATTRHEVTSGVRAIVKWLTGLMPGRSRKAARQRALATYATIVGALLLSRAVDDVELSEEFLEAARAELG